MYTYVIQLEGKSATLELKNPQQKKLNMLHCSYRYLNRRDTIKEHKIRNITIEKSAKIFEYANTSISNEKNIIFIIMK